MTKQELDDYRRRLWAEARELWDRKNLDYAAPEDVFSNWRRISAETPLSEAQVLWVLMSKHWFALERAALHGEPLASESIRSRVMDLMNYLTALGAVLEEAEGGGRGGFESGSLGPSGMTYDEPGE